MLKLTVPKAVPKILLIFLDTNPTAKIQPEFTIFTITTSKLNHYQNPTKIVPYPKGKFSSTLYLILHVYAPHYQIFAHFAQIMLSQLN